MLGTILIILLILLLIGALPRWGYSSGWGYGPSGLLGLILIIIVILVLLGRVLALRNNVRAHDRAREQSGFRLQPHSTFFYKIPEHPRRVGR